MNNAKSEFGKKLIEAGNAYTKAKETLETAEKEYLEKRDILEKLAVTALEDKVLMQRDNLEQKLAEKIRELPNPELLPKELLSYNRTRDYREFYDKQVIAYTDYRNRVGVKGILKEETETILKIITSENKTIIVTKNQTEMVIEDK